MLRVEYKLPNYIEITVFQCGNLMFEEVQANKYIKTAEL